jgi:membrane fusion protein (multidrug efflux system)
MQPNREDHNRPLRAIPEATAAEAGPREAVGAPAQRRNGRKPFLVLGAVVLVGFSGVGVYLLATANLVSTDDAQVEADVVPISARVSGQIRARLVADNQRVDKGVVLLRIDDADYSARAEQAAAELETANAQASAADAQLRIVEASAKGGLRSAQASFSGSALGVANADAQVAAAQAGLERAKADARRAQLELERAKGLAAAHAIPQEQLDEAQIAWDASQAALSQATAQTAAARELRAIAASRVDEARGRLDQSSPIDAQIAAAKANADLAHARVKVSSAALELARLQLSYTEVVAPEEGVVSRISVQPGQTIQAGQPLAELVPQHTYVVANFKETQVGRLRPGQPAAVSIDAFPGREFTGKVESLSGGTGARFSLLPPDNSTGNFVKVVQRVPVRIAWAAQPNVPLQAGLSCDVTVNVSKKQ